MEWKNASREYSTSQVAHIITKLKALGWSFNFIGANIDVKETAKEYNIDNYMEFQQDEEGTAKMFEQERASRMNYYHRIEEVNIGMRDNGSKTSRADMLMDAAADYFIQTRRVSPDKINKLKKNEIFVFGSNLEGRHGAGAAHAAVTKFGAIMGQGVGLQGKSYAIPTMQGGIDTIKPYVDEFIEFAKQHKSLRFLVTRIGCGIAGFTDQEIAPLFVEALDVENIYLPQGFLDILNQ